MTERTLRIRHGLQQKFAQELQSGKEFDFKIGNDWHRVEQLMFIFSFFISKGFRYIRGDACFR